MNKAIFICLTAVFPGSTTFAAKDVHFSDKKAYVKIDKVSISGANYVKYSGCRIDLAGTKALCNEIALVEVAAFSKMQACLGANAVGGMGGFTFAPFIVLANTNPITGAITAGIMLFSMNQVNHAAGLDEVYNWYALNDVDYNSTNLSFERYVDKLKSSLESSILYCDVAGQNLPVDPKPFAIDL